MTTKEYMNMPFELNRQIRIKERQLQGVRNLINGTATAITGIPRQDSPDPHRFEGLMAKAVDVETEISRLAEELGKAVEEVSAAINSINDAACEEVLTARYLCFEDWTTIARKLDYSRDWVYRLNRRGLDFVEKIIHLI